MRLADCGAFFSGKGKPESWRKGEPCMILLVEKEREKQRLLRLCEKTAYGCKIASIAASYGFDKSFACFWLDTESDVAFCMVDGAMLISGTILHTEETRSFLKAVGAREILCAVKNAEAMNLPADGTGDVLRKLAAEEVGGAAAEENVSIREIFGLLEETGMVEEFEPFYLDLSHRLRHGGARVITSRDKEGLRGCAVVSAISEQAAILSAVAVREDCRRQGVGSDLVRRAEAGLGGKWIYIFRDKDRNREFYKSLGYGKADTWVHIGQNG